jgi:NADP-dependent 3-hydroxy acid dehydrogenase YdfG
MSAPLVFITGASSGIGQALATRYARAGWRLAMVARRVGEIEAWARSHGLGPERCLAYAADVKDVHGLVAAARRCTTR